MRREARSARLPADWDVVVQLCRRTENAMALASAAIVGSAVLLFVVEAICGALTRGPA